jgi:hypothetical protein
VDNSFYEVNQETVRLGPKEAMQFGQVLEKVLYKVRHANPRYGPVYIGKVNLANGFYQVWLSMAVALPVYEGEEPIVAFALMLPMGWMDSVPYFCSPTETVADIANSKPTNGVHQLPTRSNSWPIPCHCPKPIRYHPYSTPSQMIPYQLI